METGDHDDDVAVATGEEVTKSLGERAVEMLPGVRENFIARLKVLIQTVQRCIDEGMDSEAVYDAMERTCKLREPPFSTYNEEISHKIFDNSHFPNVDDQLNLDRKLQNNLNNFATDLDLGDRTILETFAAIRALVARVQSYAGFIDYINIHE